MTDFWESKFKEDQTLWGTEPSDSAIHAKNIFIKNGIKDVLIPGFGYGRNASIFLDNGINVTGIEISEYAIGLAKIQNGFKGAVYHGSVTAMPFDKKMYDGIFCYALIHLLNYYERKRFIRACYNQLKPSGIMVFTVVCKKASMYGNGKLLSKNRFKLLKGLNVYFYDIDSATKEFENFGLTECSEIDEPIKFDKTKPPLKCLMIICQKPNV